ncbi:MFS transporter [Kribbella sp. WER1]
MLLAGLGMSAAAPQIATFLVTELHTSLSTAGLFYLTNLLAPVAGWVVGARSDRTGSRLGLFRWCGIAGFLGWAGIAWSPVAWLPFVISAAVLGFAGAAGSQLFAAIHDELGADRTPNPEGVVAIVRMALTAGWVIGPMLGAFGAAAFGVRATLFATALCNLVQLLPLGTLRLRTESTATAQLPRRTASLAEMTPLLVFTTLYVLVYAGESIKYAYLPLYMNQQLHLAPEISGAVIGIQPLVELGLMPLSVLVARRTGSMPLMVVGAGFGVGANLLFAFTHTAVGLFAGQILMGGVWGVFAALGIIAAQRLLPHAVATAGAIFMSSTAVSQALGGTLGGLGVGAVGLPHVFLIPGTLAAIAAIGLAVIAGRYRTLLAAGPLQTRDLVA